MTAALVRDTNFKCNYHTVVVNQQKFDEAEKKTVNAWKNMNGVTCCGVIGAGATLTGTIMLINGAVHNNFDWTGLTLFAAGIILDLITCYACFAKK